MGFVNLTTKLDDGKNQYIEAWTQSLVVVHRVWSNDVPLSDDLSAFELGSKFLHDPEFGKYTGFQNPYTFLIDRCGRWNQVAPIREVGKHARAYWNDKAIGIGVMGDFTREPVGVTQLDSLVELLASLCAALHLHPEEWLEVHHRAHATVEVQAVSGHDELPWQDPDKECPGRFMVMDEVRAHTAAYMMAKERRELVESGLVV